MSVDFPQIDQIMHASLSDDAYSQKEYVSLMNRCNNFINLTFQELLDRVSRKYNYKSLVDILNMVNEVLDEENDACENCIMFDDFVRNASLVSQSLKIIINSPSTKLIKVDKNLPANKVTKFDSKIMNWLSRRPGVTIEEKIAPKNVIPTKVTYFTTDTAENRHAMYLFDILYDYLYEKVYPNGKELKCEICPFKDKKCYILYDKLKTILFLKHKLKITDLQNVPKQKQLRQNNKLLSDKEYKQIWDAVRDIDFYEQNCRNVWSNLKERYQFVSFLIVCARITSLEGVKVFDSYSQLTDIDGHIVIRNSDGNNTIKFFDEKNNCEIITSLIGESIDVKVNKYEAESLVKYVKVNIHNEIFDLSHIFDEFESIKRKENEYKSINNEIDELKLQIKSLQDKLSDFALRKSKIQKLVKTLYEVSKVVSEDEQEKK